MNFNRLRLFFIICISPLFIKAYSNINQTIPEIKTFNTSYLSSANNVEKETEKKEESEKNNEQKETDETNALKENNIKEENKEVKATNSSPKVDNKVVEKMGSKGRVYFPSLNFSVALYNANINKGEDYDAQKIVDDSDSAAFYKLYHFDIICDHNYQGFNKLIKLNNNDKMYIKDKDNSYTYYILKQSFIGKNEKNDLTALDGTSISQMNGDLIMYTCYDKESILITIWELEK